MEEQLAPHEEERYVVRGPREEEEACGVIKTIAGPTVEGIDATALGELVCSDNADENGQDAGGEPPAERVAEEVDLLAGVVFSPEGDATKKERPLDWLRAVRMRGCERVVVVEHGALKLQIFSQE